MSRPKGYHDAIDRHRDSGNAEEQNSHLSDLLSSAGLMHPKELQKIAVKLGNGQWCRHWYQWGYTNSPWIMAVQVRGYSGSPIGCDDLKKYGFVRGDDCLYFINRADEDGKPYRG